VNPITPGDEHYEIGSSRILALPTFQITHFIFPMRMSADRHGISTREVGFWLMPWSRKEEHLPMSHVAEIEHDRGLIWDDVRIESSGGIDPLRISGLSKLHAGNSVAHVRATMVD
jgi:hypothetical protein